MGGAAVLAAPLASQAQSVRKVPRIGVLWHAGTAEEERIPLGALVQGFRKLGYLEGRNVVFEHRFPNEQPERFVALAHELVQLNVDVFHCGDPPGGIGCTEGDGYDPDCVHGRS